MDKRTLALFCLLFLGEARGNWDENGGNLSELDMGFYLQNLECSDAGLCQKCFNFRAFGTIHQFVFQYLKEPATIHLKSEESFADWDYRFVQDESSPFRMCYGEKMAASDYNRRLISRITVCIETDFTSITVPTECGKPIAIITVDGFIGFAKPRGTQVLYCAPL